MEIQTLTPPAEPNLILTQFNYDSLPESVQDIARNAAASIKAKMKKSAQDIWEIGRELAMVKDAIDDGSWMRWLDAEFEMSSASARRFVSVYKAYPDASRLKNVQASATALYRLASPETSEEARQKALELGEAGERITDAKAAEIIRSDRGEENPPAPHVVGGGQVLESSIGELSGDMETPTARDSGDGKVFDRQKAWAKIAGLIEKFREDCDPAGEDGVDDYIWLADLLQMEVDNLRHS